MFTLFKIVLTNALHRLQVVMASRCIFFNESDAAVRWHGSCEGGVIVLMPFVRQGGAAPWNEGGTKLSVGHSEWTGGWVRIN